MVVTIAVYALFLYDARAKDGSWEGLDDAVYYVKVTQTVRELVCKKLLGLYSQNVSKYHIYLILWCVFFYSCARGTLSKKSSFVIHGRSTLS